MKINFTEWCIERLLKEMSDEEAEQILGVKRGGDIQSAWKRLARLHHPDRGGSHEMSVKINNARDILVLPPLNFRRYSPEPNQWKQPEEEGPTTSRPFDKSDDDGIYGMQRQIKELGIQLGVEKFTSLFAAEISSNWIDRHGLPGQKFENDQQKRSAYKKYLVKNSKKFSSEIGFLKDLAIMFYSEPLDRRLSYEEIIQIMKAQI